MKRNYFFSFLLSILTCLGVAAQPSKSNDVCQKGGLCALPATPNLSLMLNRWRGHFQKGDVNYEVILSVYKEQGQLTATMSIPQLGIVDKKCKASFCSGNELHIKPTTIMGLTFSQVTNGSLTGTVYFTNEYTSYALAMHSSNNYSLTIK